MSDAAGDGDTGRDGVDREGRDVVDRGGVGRVGLGWGKGLLDGLKVTWQNLTRRSVTAQYPDALPELPPRSRGVIALIEENCTVCMLCARECPAWCIYIDSHKETVPPAEEGGRERSRNVLDRFAIDFSLCMYCSICIEVCPFDAIHWTPEFEYSEFDIRDLTHEKDRLRDWMWTMPPPPALETGAAEPKELETARKAVARDSAPDRAGSGPAAGGATGADRPRRTPSADRPRRTPRAEPGPEPESPSGPDGTGGSDGKGGSDGQGEQG